MLAKEGCCAVGVAGEVNGIWALGRPANAPWRFNDHTSMKKATFFFANSFILGFKAFDCSESCFLCCYFLYTHSISFRMSCHKVLSNVTMKMVALWEHQLMKSNFLTFNTAISAKMWVTQQTGSWYCTGVLYSSGKGHFASMAISALGWAQLGFHSIFLLNFHLATLWHIYLAVVFTLLCYL